MNWELIGNYLWAFANSPLGIALIIALVGGLLAKLYTKKPLWKTYEGSVIAGIKWAEKAIPDDTENKSLARLDTALKYVIVIVESATGKTVTEAQKQQLAEGIKIKHAELEASGSLEKKPEAQ